jgi:hypothetical protein
LGGRAWRTGLRPLLLRPLLCTCLRLPPPVKAAKAKDTKAKTEKKEKKEKK